MVVIKKNFKCLNMKKLRNKKTNKNNKSSKSQIKNNKINKKQMLNKMIYLMINKKLKIKMQWKKHKGKFYLLNKLKMADAVVYFDIN